MRDSVLLFLRGLLRAKEFAGGLRLGAQTSLSDARITEGYHTLASLTRVMDREWWRFIRLLEQYSPFDSVPMCIPPRMHYVLDATSEAVLWSLQNDGFVASFPSHRFWRQPEVAVDVCACETGVHADNYRAIARNISCPEQADYWRGELENFGFHEAGSSEIYRGDQYSLRMYLKDHEPPHVHVFLNELGRRCAGKIRFDVRAEVLESESLSGAIRNQIIDFVNDRRDELLRSWARCRAGELPNAIK